jgi:hypothetical protein
MEREGIELMKLERMNVEVYDGDYNCYRFTLTTKWTQTVRMILKFVEEALLNQTYTMKRIP